MPENFPPLTIIIPNYNGSHLLKRNLPAVVIAVANYNPGRARIIVVDDASQDESRMMLKEHFPLLDVVCHEKNLGFAEAVTTGIRESDTEFLILLNSDVVPDESFIYPLTTHLLKPDVFSVSPLIVDEHNRINKYSWNKRHIKRGKLSYIPWTLEEALKNSQTDDLEALFASGGSMALKKSMFESLEGFFPIFHPFYYEDFDLGVRAWQRGWRTLFEPRSVVVHAEEGSISENTQREKVRCIQRRNGFLFEWIHISNRFLLFYFFPRYIRQLCGRILAGDKIFCRGLADAAKKLPEVLAARRERARTSEMSFEDLLARLTKN